MKQTYIIREGGMGVHVGGVLQKIDDFVRKETEKGYYSRRDRCYVMKLQHGYKIRVEIMNIKRKGD